MKKTPRKTFAAFVIAAASAHTPPTHAIGTTAVAFVTAGGFSIGSGLCCFGCDRLNKLLSTIHGPTDLEGAAPQEPESNAPASCCRHIFSDPATAWFTVLSACGVVCIATGAIGETYGWQ